MIFRLIAITLFLFLNSLVGYCQNDTKSVFVPALNIYPGYIIRNYENVSKSNLAVIGSLHLAWQTKGKDAWHKFYNYPKIGLECMYTNFGNKNELGYGLGIIPVLQLKSRSENKFRSIKFGMGVTYLNKPFDALTNPNNLYFGGNFANMSIANITWGKLNTDKKVSVFYGISTIHCSNGHNSLPNAGANMVMLNIGMKWNTPKVLYSKKIDSLHIKNRLNYSLKFGLGTHEFGETTKATGGPLYPSYHTSFFVGKQFKNVHIVQAGITYSYYTSFYDYIVTQEVYPDHQKLKASTVVLFLGHEFVMGKVSFSAQGGLYVYNPFFIQQKKIDGSWSRLGQKLEAINTNRLGLLYYPFKKSNTLNNVKKQLSLGIFIKANLGQADLFEYTVAYTF